jgi:hypothetical protein
MRGLDPRIHLLGEELLTKVMDGRVKPGNDAVLQTAMPGYDGAA